MTTDPEPPLVTGRAAAAAEAVIQERFPNLPPEAVAGATVAALLAAAPHMTQPAIRGIAPELANAVIRRYQDRVYRGLRNAAEDAGGWLETIRTGDRWPSSSDLAGMANLLGQAAAAARAVEALGELASKGSGAFPGTSR